MMRNLGYEAPSTHGENPGDPILVLDDDGGIETYSLSQLFPTDITIPVTLCPLNTSDNILVQISQGRDLLLPLSLWKAAPECTTAIDILYAGGGVCTYGDDVLNIDHLRERNISVAIAKALYRKAFPVVMHNIVIEERILENGEPSWSPFYERNVFPLYPCGGRFSRDPRLCTPSCFYISGESGRTACHVLHDINISAGFIMAEKVFRMDHSVSTQGDLTSLGHALEQGNVTFLARYGDHTVRFHSYRYAAPTSGREEILLSFKQTEETL